MSNTSNSMVVQGQNVTIGTLPSARHYMAGKFGIVLPATTKGVKGPSMKDVRTQVTAKLVAEGKTEDEVKLAIKAINKEYDTNRRQFYVDCNLVNGQLAADPTLRKSLRVSKNKDGKVIGATCTYRKEKSASLSQAAQIAQLNATIAALSAKLALQAPAA